MEFDFDKIAVEFDSTRTSDPRLLESVADAVCRILGPRATILDIGSGTGRFLLPMARRGLSAVGVDISRNMLLRAKEKGLELLIRADAAKLPFQDLQFDASFFSSVLHLMETWKEAVMEGCRVSRKAVIALDPGRQKNDNPHDIFKSIMKEKGFEVPQKGPYEIDLCKTCAPVNRIALPSFEERMSRRELLAVFEKRTYTYQARLSEAQNRECLGMLEKVLPDVVCVRWEPALIVWDPKKLAQDVRKTTFCYPH